MAWHKAIYIMEYTEKSEKKQQKIYAQTLKNAKIQAKAISEKNNIGIMYELKLDKVVYRQ